MSNKVLRVPLACAMWVMLVAALPAAESGNFGKRIETAAEHGEWLNYGLGYAEQRYSPLHRIDSGNVATLGLQWYYQFDTDRGQEATPLIADGILYTTTSWSKVYAIDARTGKPIWSFDPKVDGAKGFDACCDVVNRGVALWQNRVFVGALDGRLIALDARSGKVLWSVQTTDTTRPYTITGAPRVVKGKVIIGNGGAEYGVRGFVSAYDVATGKLAWRFYITPNPKGEPDHAASDKVLAGKAASTWFGEAWKASGGGGTAWDAMAYDEKLDLLYVGTGNGSPWNHKIRSEGKGDNLFLSSILALRPDTGEYVWHYQTTPGDSWDYTATQHIMLADLTVGGQSKRVVMQAPKNGFYYVLDAANGKLISAQKYVPLNWAERIDLETGRPVEDPRSRYLDAPSTQVTGPLGGHNWQPMSFNPTLGLVYIPAMVSAGNYTQPKTYEFTLGAQNQGQDIAVRDAKSAPLPPPPASISAEIGGRLVAWDPVTQQARWTVRQQGAWNGGTLATAGNLLFAGVGKDVVAYAADTGKSLWTFATGNGVIAPPITYELDGQQYLAVMAGYGGARGPGGPELRRPGRLLVFRLGAAGELPVLPTAPAPRPPLNPATLAASSADPAAGQQRYFRFCRTCHETGIFIPSLRDSPYLATSDAWQSVVRDGALRAGGMAPFARFMDAGQIESIRAWVITQVKPAAADAR